MVFDLQELLNRHIHASFEWDYKQSNGSQARQQSYQKELLQSSSCNRTGVYQLTQPTVDFYRAIWILEIPLAMENIS